MATICDLEHFTGRRQDVLTVSPEAGVDEAAALMSDRHIGCVVVADEDGRIAGILSERDVIRRVVARGMSPEVLAVAAVMTRSVIVVTPDTSLEKVRRIMADHGVRHLPIVEHGQLVGIISSRDVLAHELSATQAALQQQSMLLSNLELQHPGISSIRRDDAGRVVI